MKLLVAGDFAFDIYEPALCAGLRAAGAEVTEFHARSYYGPVGLLARAQEKYVFGPGVVAANAALLARCALARPEALVAFRAPWLHPRTIALLRKSGLRKLVLINNDDPFGPDRDLPLWRAFRRSVPAADLVLAYRAVNVPEYAQAGAREVRLLRSWFNPAVHRPLPLTDQDRARFGCDVVFVGHCEPDARLGALDALFASGLRVRLFGTGWEKHARGRAWQAQLPVARLSGDEYVRAIAAARVALVFLSARNRDTYTRRCFEIPAIGTAMLAPRTPDLQSLFREEEEALFYASPSELVSQARELCGDELRRRRVARAGRERVLQGGHDNESRARELLGYLRELPSRRGGE